MQKRCRSISYVKIFKKRPMKILPSILFVLLILMIASCSSSDKITTPSKNKNSTLITPIKGNVVIKVGQLVHYTGRVHGSVGQTLEVKSRDESILKLKETDFEYDNPSKHDMPGGDGGEKTYFFEALKVGKTNVLVEESFRGEKTNTYEIEIVVEK